MKNNPKRKVYLSSHWHHFVKRKPRSKKNPYRRNPSHGSMMPWLLIGGAAFLFLTPSGRAIAARFTGGVTPSALPPGVPPGSVRLPDGTYRTPSGAIIGSPGSGVMAPLAALVPGVTSAVGGWLRDLLSGSSATTPGAIINAAPPESGGVPAGDLTGTHDILTGGYQIGDPLPPIPDLMLGSPNQNTDFWSSIDTSGWWGNSAPIDPNAGPVPIFMNFGTPTLDLSLAPADTSWQWPWEGLMGFRGFGEDLMVPQPYFPPESPIPSPWIPGGTAAPVPPHVLPPLPPLPVPHGHRMRPTGNYRFRQPPSFR